MNKSKIAYILVLLIITFSGCSEEDDLNEIFVGNTFHITGLTFNRQTVSKDVKEFYEAGNEAYYITFSTNTFQGVLKKGSHIEGTWNADNKSHKLTLRFGNNTSLPIYSEIQEKTYTILTHATVYSGDSQVLRIEQDKDSYITMTTKKLK